MHKNKEILKIKAYLETSLTLLINKLWLEPEEVGSIVAECSKEACKGIYGTENGSCKTLREDWLREFEQGFSSKLTELIEIGEQ